MNISIGAALDLMHYLIFSRLEIFLTVFAFLVNNTTTIVLLVECVSSCCRFSVFMSISCFFMFVGSGPIWLWHISLHFGHAMCFLRNMKLLHQ